MRQYPAVDAAFAFCQIEGYQLMKRKHPTLAAIDGWEWPARVSIEQCSGEEASRYKSETAERYCKENNIKLKTGADLTGGLGADSYHLSALCKQWYYVEKDKTLCRIAAHNFALTDRNVDVCNETAETFIENNAKHFSIIYADPSRRSPSGNKLIRIADCSPDLTTLAPTILERADMVLLKLSPMLDLHDALSVLPSTGEVHIVAVGGEVKEVLILCGKNAVRTDADAEKAKIPVIHAVNLEKTERQEMCFTSKEEACAQCEFADDIAEGDLLFEPNASIMKAGAFRLTAERYGLKKAAQNTHLYVSKENQQNTIESFPGRVFCVEEVTNRQSRKRLAGSHANVICRNYPLKADELRKQMKIQDGGDRYLIGFRIADKNTLVLCKRIK